MEEALETRELDGATESAASRPKAPLVRGWPLVGSATTFLEDPVRFLLSCYREHGPIFRIRLGPTTYTVLAGVEGTTFATRGGRGVVVAEGMWEEPSRIMGSSPRSNMANVDGARHAELRGLFRVGMSRSAVHEAMGDAVSIAREAFEDARITGGPMDSVALAKRITFAQLGQAMAGEAPRGMFDASSAVLDAIVRGTRVPWLRRLPLPPRTRRAAREVRDIALSLLSRPSATQPSFLREVHEGLRRGLYAEADLSMLMLTPFIAGLDTMAHTFGFVLYRLTQHPEWQARLRAELTQALGASETIDEAVIARCSELTAFVQEVMRIHPLSPAALRRAARDFVAFDHRVEAGDLLMLAHTLPHLMEEHFTEPERFDPSRFVGEAARTRGAHRFAPFGVGSHVCLGAGLAELLLRVNTAALLRDHDVVAADKGYRLRVSNTSGARPLGFRIRVVPRAV